ncbi:amino acid ABC transporter permease [Arcanobacterium pinnipediorum]|uniref:Amino acid ABC transporter permease n=1 Tax=Arcanobacterium pinnipediorum TaxID=1503041 RepID=A0ABY5AFG5_9ACTO|nr:amino acid ABC transporter permease [Arcanobacterium pinnipediorum]USR78802.1 amino acid ABC transporter permease [Arcanobacterium pinnipediorum]
MDIAVLEQWLPFYVQAALLTLRIGVIGTALAFVVGLICESLRELRVPVIGQIVTGYVEISRNTPLLVQLFFLYFGLPKLGIVLDGESAAIIGLTFLGGSYMIEALRSGFGSVTKVQRESALALGMKRQEVIRYVVLPQALAYALPALMANVIFLIKETSVVSVVALPDLVYVAKEQIGNTYTTNEALALLVVSYAVILVPIVLLAVGLERRVRHGLVGK